MGNRDGHLVYRCSCVEWMLLFEETHTFLHDNGARYGARVNKTLIAPIFGLDVCINGTRSVRYTERSIFRRLDAFNTISSTNY